jgi:hypothetical protein
MISKNPSAVLIHGHHLQAPEWERLVWGTSGLEQVGRIPRGIEVAVKEQASLIMWGTGASVDPVSGKKESEYTYSFALEHSKELAPYVGLDQETLTTFIKERSQLQLDTTNTKDETYEALKMCKEQGIHTLYLVSSPTHIPRCLLTACQLQSEFAPIVLCGVAAETFTEFWQPKDVAVVEPSHLPDRAETPFNLLAKRMASARK